ncbi:MAG TPA: DUF5302 domain-containing protein [Candidatus Nanopelagicales bacterium]|nr:DUF5302 domain-containing protein [Candidatus Nanopelagicales bacterium]
MADAPDDDLKAKYREALERKNASKHTTSTKGSAEASRGAKGEHASEANRREFRRKSGG